MIPPALWKPAFWTCAVAVLVGFVATVTLLPPVLSLAAKRGIGEPKSDRTRRYCAVPGGLWLQSWLLWHFPQTYSRLRDMKG